MSSKRTRRAALQDLFSAPRELAEHDALARRSREGVLRRVRAGEDIIGKAPFGFERAGSQRVVHPVQWPAVQWLFANAVTTPSVAQLSREYAQLVAFTRHGDISASYLRRLLRDRIYVTGRWSVQLHGETITMPPVHLPEPIDAETFAAVQTLLDQRSQ